LNLLISGFRPGPGQRIVEVNQPRLTARAKELFANEGGEPFYYVVWRSDGSVQGKSDAVPQLTVPPKTNADKLIRMRDDIRELIHFTPTGRCFLIGRSIRSDRAAMRADAISLGTIGAGALLIGLALAWWIASQVTRPLVRISQTAKQIATGDLSQRICLGNTDDELGDVANVLNETFARLEAAFARQKQFTADASHELRTPLSLILTHAQGALLREQSPAEYREALSDCVHAAQRMKTLVESLLDLARFDASAAPINSEPCDLAALTQDCVNLLQPLAEAKQLRLEVNLRKASTRCDPVRVAQVITNLLANAIQYTPTGGAVAVQTRIDGGAEVSVSDTGPGIASEQLPHIFERFRRLDTSRTRATGGIGLGLAICKAIIDAHGGTIAVRSEIAQGTTFTVQLPAG
jgi:heavy metal sensor kinase